MKQNILGKKQKNNFGELILLVLIVSFAVLVLLERFKILNMPTKIKDLCLPQHHIMGNFIMLSHTTS